MQRENDYPKSNLPSGNSNVIIKITQGKVHFLKRLKRQKGYKNITQTSRIGKRGYYG